MPDDILREIGEELLLLVSRPDLPLSILTTLIHALIGLSIAVAVLMPVVLVAFVRRWEQSIGTASLIFNTVPALAWILLLITSFGVFSPLPIILTVSLTVLPILLPTANSSVRVFITRLMELAKLVNAPTWRSFRLIVLPAYGPLIVSYVRAGLGFAVKMAMVAEAFSASNGFGSRMMLAYSLGNIPQLAAMSVFAVVLAVAADYAGRWLLGWRKDWS
ncbi:MAG: ABC transporter permease subunit [Thaumarchaeota archaeon]|nr:ABC transporter permease subunit [Nitrososphaerota archaeon]